jgi:hypothetical protein
VADNLAESTLETLDKVSGRRFLEGVAESELQVALATLGCHLPETRAARVGGWVVPIRMVRPVKRLETESDFLCFLHMKILKDSEIMVLEARTI